MLQHSALSSYALACALPKPLACPDLEQNGNMVSFQKFNLEKRAQPLGDLNFQRAF